MTHRLASLNRQLKIPQPHPTHTPTLDLKTQETAQSLLEHPMLPSTVYNYLQGDCLAV